jgi:hypothetical protein
MVKVRPQRPVWRQEKGENCIQQLVDLQKEPSPVYLISDMNWGCQVPQSDMKIEVLL